MSNQINTPVGIPSELNFSLPSSMVPSRKFELRVQPYGQSSFTTPGQAVRIVLPQMARTLYNLQTAYVTGTVSFTHAGVANTDYSYVLGTWYSLFSRQVVRAGSGYVLETLDNPGQLVNALLSMTLNPGERTALSNTFGFDSFYSTSTTNSSNGVNSICAKLNVTGSGFTGTNLNYSFAFPLIGILNAAKLWPAWNNGDLEIELTLAQFTDYIKSVTANTVTGINISNLEFVTECLELAPEAYNMIMAQNPEKVVIKSQSYTFGSSQLSASTGPGAVDIPFQIKVNSLKHLIWYASPSDVIDGTYGGVNPNLDNWNFVVNGISYPQQPVKAKFPAEAFMQNQKSFGSVYSNSHSGMANRLAFCVCSPATPGTTAPYNNFYTTYDNLLGATDLETKSHKFYQALDLETINSNKESLYSGISTNGTTSTIRLNISAQIANTAHRIYYWSSQDVMVVMDMVNGITSVIQ